MTRALARTFFAIVLAVVALNLALVSPFFLTIFLGWMLCEILRKFHDRMLAQRMRRGLASLLATLVAAVVIVVPFAVFAVATLRKGVRFAMTLAQDPSTIEKLADRAYAIPFVERSFESSHEFREWAIAQAQAAGSHAPTLLSKGFGSIPDLLGQLALALLACYFFLNDGRRFSAWIAPRIPISPAIRHRLAMTSKAMVVQSALATLAAALAQAIVILIGFLVLKLPVAGLAFGVAFIFAWLPIVGVTPVWGITMIVLFAQGESGKALAIAGFGLLSGVTDNVVRPWVLKGGSDLHPLVSLIVIFGHMYFFGIVGVFTGPVFAAVMIECLEVWPETARQLGLAAPAEPPSQNANL